MATKMTNTDIDEFKEELEALDEEYKHDIFYLFNRWIIYPLMKFMLEHKIFDMVVLVICIAIVVVYFCYLCGVR